MMRDAATRAATGAAGVCSAHGTHDREADHHPVRRQQAEADRGVRGPRQHRDGRGERRADDEPAGLGRARADAGVRRVHARPARHAAGRDREGTLDVHAGQAVIAPRGEWVRYSTPEEGGAEYVAVCVPAFSRTPSTATRSEAMRARSPSPRSLSLLPAAGAAADPSAAVFPPGWKQGWARSVEGRKLSYRWGYPGFAVSLLCRAVDATWAIEWEGEPPPGRPRRDGHLRLARRPEHRPSPAPLRAAARRPAARHLRHGRRD